MRRPSDERGASLLLVIGFMVMFGLIGSAMIAGVTTGLRSRVSLDSARDREYAADGTIEAAIAQVRLRMTSGNALSPCPPTANTQSLNDVQIRVECSYVPTLADGFWQRNAIFTAYCDDANQANCSNTDPIIRAQVNFESPSVLTLASIVVTGTSIQSWSVNQ